jgi:hypothetical protein
VEAVYRSSLLLISILRAVGCAHVQGFLPRPRSSGETLKRSHSFSIFPMPNVILKNGTDSPFPALPPAPPKSVKMYYIYKYPSPAPRASFFGHGARACDGAWRDFFHIKKWEKSFESYTSWRHIPDQDIFPTSKTFILDRHFLS